jgi:hypothetical protein
VITANMETGELGQLVTIPSQDAGPVLVVRTDSAVQPVTTTTAAAQDPVSTTPPLVAGDTGDDGGIDLRWIGGGAIVAFLGILAWLAVRQPRQGD